MPIADIPWAINTIKTQNGEYSLYERYYCGDHDLLFATEKFRNAFGALFQKFALNLMPAVVEAFADRTVVQGFDGALSSAAQKLWKRNRMGRMATRTHLEAIKSGDAYVLVWPDKQQRARIWMQKADQCTVEYDDEDDPCLIVRAAKCWINSEERVRLNLYYPNVIERYISNVKVSGGTCPEDQRKYSVYDGGHTLNPYGVVPLFHFAHKADVGDLGKSGLADVIPIQDAMNKTVMDKMVDMEFLAYPQRYATGLQIEIDEDTGKAKNPPFVPGADRVWVGSGDVKFGQFSAADLRQFIEIKDSFALDMCRIVGLPPHLLYVGNAIPTGEGLKVQEGRMVKQVEDDQTSFGDSWAAAIAFGLLIEGGSVDMDELSELDLEVIWKPAAPHNPLLDSETQLVKEQVGVSQRQAMRELGYTDEQIESMIAEDLEDQLQQSIAMQAVQPQPQLLGPDGKPMPGQAQQNGSQPGQQPSAFTRNGSPGQASKVAPQQQQGKKTVAAVTQRITGLKPGTLPAQISPLRPRGGAGSYQQ